MSRLFIVLISFAALIPKADLSQLRLVGNLYTHFSEFHSGGDHNSAFSAFMSFCAEHYGNMNHEHPDEDEHEQLPFKNITSSGFIVLNKPFAVLPLEIPVQKDQTFPDYIFYTLAIDDSIDHPPTA
ncbi:hypothetical protein [Algoriphagus sediminis]|uniref:Uncharacterized protein n=1 Tax=Algoriphagus sediminis TaxID=3057113 RepID=A0ABT7YD03_9BACT|nr:hypothetical protein [Algoriphagus sediminis]MDN3204411.1 hypothetical protein [Algoriphagus sediminis]